MASPLTIPQFSFPPLFILAVPLSPPEIAPCIPTPDILQLSLTPSLPLGYFHSVSPCLCPLLFLPSVLLSVFSCYFFHPLCLPMSLPPTLLLLSLPVNMSELNPSLVVTKPLKSCIANVLNPHAYPTFFLQQRLVIPLRHVCLNSPLSVII